MARDPFGRLTTRTSDCACARLGCEKNGVVSEKGVRIFCGMIMGNVNKSTIGLIHSRVFEYKNYGASENVCFDGVQY